ncbi:hypothetical protein CspeluHIS016_0502910 [Cutaneotrichosporon spelunceum]|uniref:Protein UNC80 C-terminal domain-containing protein n=1 Tax=Cutaneotrichosporon spelunceum TaxID=1672016 RepID=A0AAD3TWR3_9TREE|nr:hypothetical protein CspeluHIS016_0502910 [Cutaneotrichosporon spelunceum]
MAPADRNAGPAPTSASLKRSSATRKHSTTATVPARSQGLTNEWSGAALNDEPTSVSRPPSISSSGLSNPSQVDRSRSATVSSVDIPLVLSPISMGSMDSVSRHPSAKSPAMTSMPEGVVAEDFRPSGRAEPAVSFTTPDKVPPRNLSQQDIGFGASPSPPLSSCPGPHLLDSDVSSSPAVLRPILTNTPVPGLGAALTSASSRPKPQLRLSTQDLPAPSRKEDKPPISPGMKHWQQVRQHVVTDPPPVDSKPKRGLVSRTAGRFGFRSVVENVLGYDRRRRSTYGAFSVDMTDEEREEASRERRRFARAVKTCLDECAAEESTRRLRRLAAVGGHVPTLPLSKPKSTHHSAHGGRSRSGSVHALDNEGISAFYPLLSALVKFSVDAKSKRLWSRTCPHHAAILAELGTAFLPDSTSRDSERAQALQVFFTIVTNWSTDSDDDELDRWLWLCRAMLRDDRQTRDRGMGLLSLILKGDGNVPEALVRPASALDFESVAIALLELLHTLENSGYASDEHQRMVWDLLASLGAGEIIAVDAESVMSLLDDESLTVRNAERELLWIAAAKVIAANKHVGAWMLDCKASVLLRFAPPPVLPGMPHTARKLRILATKVLLHSFTTLLRYNDDEDVVTAVADMAEEIFDEAMALPERDGIEASYASALLALHCASSISGSPYSARLEALLAQHKDIIPSVAQGFITTFPAARVMTATRQFLQADMPLGRACIPLLLEHLSALPPSPEARAFLTWLSTAQPNLFYKPLFACAAATQGETLAKPLRVVAALAEQLGADVFWTDADPQMVAIVLGDMSSTKAKRNARGAVVNVKLGRYALLLELLVSLQGLKGPQLATFAQSLETRLGAMLELEESRSVLPTVYRSLVAQLIHTLRLGSGLIKRTSTIRLAVQWYTSSSWRTASSGTETSQIDVLTQLYKSDTEVATKSTSRIACLKTSLSEVLPALFVTTQASLASEDWAALLPVVWERYAGRDVPVDQLTFLLMKCAEAARGGLRNLVSTELYNAGPSVRSYALLKLAMLYGYRFQVYTQDTVTDRRGLIFRFPQRQLEFVVADMGSSVWVTPRDAQNAALQKYGRALPLELRQRLMELGWTEDEEMTATDIERLPVTAVPLTGKGSVAIELKQAAAPVLKRKGSNSSLNSNSAKAHRAVIPPDLVAIVIDQARQLATADDIGVELLSKELVRMFERDDATLFIRPVSEELPHDITNALLRVNGVITQPTPGFAHAALNALVGFLKTAARDNAQFPYWAQILGTVARLVPNVSELSLRDVRKSKSEHVLVPASIYETEGGFKVHRPWQENGLLDVQVAQLVLLSAILRANPHDVYLVKKMLFHLQVQEGMRYLPFARAWVELIVDLFTTVNSNYNDRAELRHFLYNITAALSLHDGDMIVVAHGMRALTLCATRFRRVFASIGFVSIMPPVYAMYVRGHGGIRDAVEYACRSFYRIHQDVFVYQLCLALAEHMHKDAFDARAAYDLLAVLATDDPASGVPSGIRDLNRKYEVEVLLQMQSGGAEVALSTPERLSSTLEPAVFPTDNIVRLLVTVIAVNAASQRGIHLLDFFGALAPHLLVEERLRLLVHDAVDVIGRFIQRMRSSDDTALQRLVPGDVSSSADWPAACNAYMRLIGSITASGRTVGVQATRRVIGLIPYVHSNGGSSALPDILGALGRANVSAETSFLTDLAPVYTQYVDGIDFSGVLDAITSLIRQNAFRLPASIARLIVEDYVGPALRSIARGAEAKAFAAPIRRAAVELLSLAVFLPGVDALHELECVPSTAGLLAAVVIPVSLALDPPPDCDVHGTWVRLLRFTLRTPVGPPHARAAHAALALQVVKIVTVRVPDIISSQRGLWTHLATYAKSAIAEGNGRFLSRTPRLVDWMMWSLFELVSLHRSPLALTLRLRIQTALAAVSDERDCDTASSRPSTAGSVTPTPRSLSGLVRRPSARIPSVTNLSPLAARVSSTPLVSVPESDLLHPSPMFGSPSPSNPSVLGSPTPSHTRSLSAASASSAMSAGSVYSNVSLSSPHPPSSSSFSHNRSPSTATTSSTPAARRSLAPIKPSFSVSAARRASRATFDAFERRFSTAPRPADRETIVHLLGPSPAASGPTIPTNASKRDVLHAPLLSQLAGAARRALLVTLVVYGYEVEEDVDVHAWSASDALHAITEETHVLIEDELADMFNLLSEVGGTEPAGEEGHGGESKRSSYAQPRGEPDLPSLSYTLNHGFDEGYAITTESPRNSLDRGASREIPTVAISLA